MKVIERIITIEYIDQRMSRQISGKFRTPSPTVLTTNRAESGRRCSLGYLSGQFSGDHVESLRKRRRCSIGPSSIFKKPMKSGKRKKKQGKALKFDLASGATPKKASYQLFGAASKCLKKKQSGACLQIEMPTVDC